MQSIDYEKHAELKVARNHIPGLLYINLAVHGDNRGDFSEVFQRTKLVEQGLPKDFTVVQRNRSRNATKGTTRGIHAEPWDKYISIDEGRAFAAIVDFRKGENFGTVETFELHPGCALFVPEGCGNSFQTLTDNVIYSYLVNKHWSPDAQYTMLNLADSKLAIKWPIPLKEATVSDKDLSHPHFKDLKPMES